MKTRSLLRPAFLLLLIFAFANGLSAQSTVPRQHINFDEDWKFHLGHAADPAKDFNYSVEVLFAKSSKAENTAVFPNFNDSAWQKVDLPHDWAVALPFVNSTNSDVMGHGYKPIGGLYPQNSIGWYRKSFSLTRADSSYRYSLQFDGIFRDSRIWINGFYVGNNESGYIGATYDITDYLNYDKPNVLVVRVDASQYEGWFYEGAGIYRHVWLNKYDNLHLKKEELFVHADVINKAAAVTVECIIENQHLVSANATTYSYVTDREGRFIARAPDAELQLPAFVSSPVKQFLNIPEPRLWSLKDPYLYRLVSIVKNGNKVVDSLVIRFGVRSVEITADRGLLLNGERVKIKGVNCHQDHAGVGSALPDYLQYYRIRLLKEMGVNAYRTSHNPPTPELLEACDSLGMLVLDENRLLNSSPEYQDQLERLIKRDRNHPSVFLWSIANEEFWIQGNSHGRRIAQTLIQRQQQLDPTRTCTYASDFGNVFPGVNEVIPVRGFNYRVQFMEAYHHDHPAQPVVGTEMGSTVTTRGIYVKDSIVGYVPDQDITFPWWASTAEYWWSMVADQPWNMGGFVWTGFDYRGEPTPFQWPNINSHFGIMDMCGFPKNIYYYYQSWWSDRDVIHISPHWNWKGKEGQPIEVWVNTNGDDVELFLNGRSLGQTKMIRNRHLTWNVPYEPGTLEAVSYRNGHQITAKVETTGEAARIVLTPDRTVISADGKDATVVNISVVDKQGREVPDANHLIQFSMEGNARILGVGNGDPSSHEADQCAPGAWQRHLFNGRCQLILQAGKTMGTVRVTGKSDGLEKGSAEILISDE